MVEDIRGGDDLQPQVITCGHCNNEQNYLEFFRFCEFCRKPLDLNDEGGDRQISFTSSKFSNILGGGQNKEGKSQTNLQMLAPQQLSRAGASIQSWNSAANPGASAKAEPKKWKGPMASRPIGFPSEELAERKLVRAKTVVDFVVLEEIGEVVKFEAMNLIDNLLLVNTPEKQTQLAKVKKHKHVIFADDPVDHSVRPKPATNGNISTTIITTTTIQGQQNQKVPQTTPEPPLSQPNGNQKIVLVEQTEQIVTTTVPPKRKIRLAEMPIAAPPMEEVVEEVEEIEEIESSSSSSEEVEYVKESVVGVCDFNFCKEKTFMRCDYDMNDIIDPRSNKCQLVLTCRWKGIRGCERQFCHFHAGQLMYWPSSCVGSRTSIALLPCDDCYYWVRYVKCKFWGTICLFFLWLTLVILIVYFSAQGVKGSYDFEYKMNQF